MNTPRQKRELRMIFVPESHILNVDTDRRPLRRQLTGSDDSVTIGGNGLEWLN